MIRILTSDETGAITITIDGRLVGQYTDEVETSVRRAMEQKEKQVRIFLRNVAQIDEAGHALLARLSKQGVELSAAGIYSSYVVANVGR